MYFKWKAKSSPQIVYANAEGAQTQLPQLQGSDNLDHYFYFCSRNHCLQHLIHIINSIHIELPKEKSFMADCENTGIATLDISRASHTSCQK